MSGAIPIITYLYSYLLFQLIYAASLSLPKGMCLCYQNPDDGSKINGIEVQKNAHSKSKGQCKDKISVSKRIQIFSCTTMIAKHVT